MPAHEEPPALPGVPFLTNLQEIRKTDTFQKKGVCKGLMLFLFPGHAHRAACGKEQTQGGHQMGAYAAGIGQLIPGKLEETAIVILGVFDAGGEVFCRGHDNASIWALFRVTLL